MSNGVKVIDRKRYVVLECQFAREWEIVRESRHGVTSEEAQEIVDYWLKYKQITAERIMIVEVPSIVKRDY